MWQGMHDEKKEQQKGTYIRHEELGGSQLWNKWACATFLFQMKT